MAEEGSTKPQPKEDEAKTDTKTVNKASANPSENKYEVRINSFQIADALGVVAVHNEIAFYENGKVVLALNGNAYNTQTGEFEHFASSPNHTLRVNLSAESIDGKMKLAESVKLGDLTREEFFEKIGAATTAAKFINDNKIEYAIIGGPTHEAQNSNSVATSLLHSMGYEYPAKELGSVWAPGSKRNLLPDDWSTDDVVLTKVFNDMKQLYHPSIKAAVKDEKTPRVETSEGANYFPTLFKPNETTVPYVKKGEEVRRPPDTTVLTDLASFSTSTEEPVKELTEEEKAAELDTILKRDAAYEASFVVNKLVADATGLDENDLDQLYKDDPQKYFDIAEQELAKTSGILQTSARVTGDQMDVLMAKKLGITLDKLYDQPNDARNKAYDELNEAGAFDYKRDNPHLRKEVENSIQRDREETLRAKAEVSAESQEPNDEPAKPDHENAPSGFKSSAQPAIKTDQNLTNSFSGAANSQAAQPKPDQNVEISNPALQQKVAANSSSYLSTGTTGPA